MRPIAEEQVSEVFVVVGGSRAVDHNTASYAIPRLNVEMTVVPARAVLGCSPSVSDRISWCSGALGDSSNSIVGICKVLTDPVEMNARPVVLHVIGDMHD